MSEDDHKYDIQIADEEWIEYVNIDGRYADAIDLDGHFSGLWPLIDRLETHCVAGCCGFNHAQLQAACDQAVRSMVAAGSDVFLSARMNNLVHQHMILRLLEHSSLHRQPSCST